MADQATVLRGNHHATNSTPICSPRTLHNICLPDANIHSITASEVHNYGYLNAITVAGNLAYNYTDLDFCNVTVTYSHKHQNDTVHVSVWLPLSSNAWNGRFQGTGGGGFATGYPEELIAPAIGQGYAAAQTDGGHSEDPILGQPEYWALNEDGEVDQQLLLNFAYLSLYEMTVLGKAITKAYYGHAPTYSYWHGCSTGGRQGLAMAQRYPDAYDGILALSPAINFDKVVAMYWAQLVSNILGYHPPRCELQAITAAAIEACDGQDGVVDDILSLPGLCKFDATALVGSSFACGETELVISAEAAEIANAAWTGPRNHTTGELEWFGLMRDAWLVTTDAALPGLVDTNCTNATDASTCVGVPFEAASDWIKYFGLRDPDYDLTTLSYADYDAIALDLTAEYGAIMGTANANLSAFRAAGSKMITTHGLADGIIFPNGSTNYYDRVLENDAAAQEFYRLFLLPGVPHCYAGGPGPFPIDQLQALTRWVEEGDAPDTLTASFDLVPGGISGERLACMYPAVQTYIGGDPYVASSFTCQ